MTRRQWLAGWIVVLATSPVLAEIKLEGAACPVSGKPAQERFAASHHQGKVFFADEASQQAFASKPAAYAVQANYQLFVTGQAKQVNCPFTGRKLNARTPVKVAQTEVCACSEQCQDFVSKLIKGKPAQAVLELYFNERSFERGFQVSR